MAGEEEEKKPAAKSKEKAKPKAKASKEPKSDTPAEKVRKTRTVKRTYVDEKGYKRELLALVCRVRAKVFLRNARRRRIVFRI